MGITGERFPGSPTDVYMTLPSAVLNLMTGDVGRVASISEGIVRFAGIETRIIMVPAGESIGLTTKLAAKLGIPPELNKIRFRVKNRVLIIG